MTVVQIQGSYPAWGCVLSQQSLDLVNVMEEQAPNPTPILGSSLLKAASSSKANVPKMASSGSSSIDNLVLQGGFRYGEITSIAGPHGTEKTTVCGRLSGSTLKPT